MDQRKSLRDQIIDRRMHELLDTDATKWDVSPVDKSADQPIGAIDPLPPGAATITIELYGGKNVVNNKELEQTLVPALLNIPGVIFNPHLAGEGDRFVMAIVRDRQQRSLTDRQLRTAITDALTEAGIEHINWDVGPLRP